jgi:hypothetical protein
MASVKTESRTKSSPVDPDVESQELVIREARSRQRWRRAVVAGLTLIVASAAALALAVGSGGRAPGTTGTSQQSGASAQLHSAMRAVLSAPNFTIKTVGGQSGQKSVDTAVIQNPDRISVTGTANGRPGPPVIVIGSSVYQRRNGPWLHGDNKAALAETTNGILLYPHILDRAKLVTRSGSEYVIPGGEAHRLLRSADNGASLPQHISISAQVQGGIVKSISVRMTGKTPPSKLEVVGPTPIVITITISNVGTSPPVKVPALR